MHRLFTTLVLVTVPLQGRALVLARVLVQVLLMGLVLSLLPRIHHRTLAEQVIVSKFLG